MDEHRERDVDRQREVRELERVNDKFAELVQVLLDRIEGEKEESYAYSFKDGWKQKQEDTTKDELQSEDLDAQLREIKQLIEKYS